MELITIQVMYTRLQGRSCNLHIFNKIVGRYQAKIHENLPENGPKPKKLKLEMLNNRMI